jgi:aerobic carbon-monoxide dehydrogenase small subunit
MIDVPVDGRLTVKLTVNGVEHSVETSPRTLLADLLRDQLGLTGTNLGCEHGYCGACTVLVDGETVRSCLMLAPSAEGAEIVTVEGLSPDEGLSPLQQSFQEAHGLQCGFCTPGMLITATELLERTDGLLEEAEVREAISGNICRCTGYVFIVDAIRRASERRNG